MQYFINTSIASTVNVDRFVEVLCPGIKHTGYEDNIFLD
jgi:hypothetical protein